MHITVTSSARNAEGLACKCIWSVTEQTHEDVRHIFIDAASEDGTATEARFAAGGDSRVEVRDAPAALNALENLLPVWRSLPDDEVIAWVDGDDALAIPRALEFVSEAHERGAWVTYGQFISDAGEMGFAGPVGTNPRKERWSATHLKTFRAGLVKRMRSIDFEIYADGKAWGGWDQLIMMACLEQAAERARYIPRFLYLYSYGHSFELHGSPEEKRREHEAVRRIRSLPKYERVDRL